MHKPRKATMLDVAREAGVSYQTVSRVINEHPSVAEKTRQRVLEIIKTLNYRPSKVARSLATRQSNTLAVITYGMHHYGPSQMVTNIEQSAKAADYDLIYANIHPESDDDVETTIESIERRAIDGLLLIAPVQSNQYNKLVQKFSHLPLLQIDITPGADVASVIIDQHQGSYEITHYLLGLKHRRLCEISGPMNWYGAIARHAGFLHALEDAGLSPVSSAEGDWTPQSGYVAAKRLLEKHDFTALVACNDQMALGAIHAIREAGLRVPEDISVVGFDDIPEASFFAPPLTTVHQDFSELGRQGVAYLLEMIADPDYKREQRVIRPQIVVRNSAQMLT